MIVEFSETLTTNTNCPSQSNGTALMTHLLPFRGEHGLGEYEPRWEEQGRKGDSGLTLLSLTASDRGAVSTTEPPDRHHISRQALPG